jgi:aminoglycoside phosphotransferase (APT) family kinase protein
MSQREQLAMTWASAAGVPTPEVYASGVVNGRPALLLGWCEGVTVSEALQRDPARAESLGMVCGRVLAGVKDVTVPEEWRRPNWLDWAPLDGAQRARLESIGQHDRLLHLDFHPLNVMVDAARDTVTGVLDWANALAGDPRADLARSRTILLLDAVEHFPEFTPVIEAFDRAFVAGYSSVAGPQSDDELAPFYAWAGHLMLHDLRHRLAAHSGQRERIDAWIARWGG